MERAKDIWEKELKLPPLRPQSPWYGYSLGQWDEESTDEAAAALKGEYYKTGDKLAERRVPVKPKKSDK
jgi:4-hydroxy-3-polyprenylbenzoate decarboxylase